MAKSGVYLLIEKLPLAIGNFAEGVTFTAKEFDKPKMTQYTVTVPNETEAMLCCYQSDGRYTLTATNGKNRDLSEKIKAHILRECLVPEIENKTLFVRNMTDEEYKALIEYLGCYGAVVDSVKELALGSQHKIIGKYGGAIYLNRFKTGSFSVQGTSNLLKMYLVEALTELLPYKEIIDAQIKSHGLDKDVDESLEELRAVIPKSFDFLGETIQSIVCPALVFRKLDLKLTEYSTYVFPVLKGLEGFIKKLFLDHGVTITESTFSSYISHGKVQSKYVSLLNNPDVVEAIENSYNLYKNNRHTVFHVDGTIIATRIIEDSKEADEIVDDVFSIMESSITNISKSKKDESVQYSKSK
ncbi:RNase LS family HEPN domain-containing protein [Sphingobacterium multivorum]|uniref:RNase LS family HEPN domain-containing protein n=1 Tax=Sphingobacterium multivorum TaxID=28454 RepID=UPI0028A6CDBC|nr:RNase LS family HEPN domain-containing protein [Sphingobacterium multivorum]